MRWLDPAYWRDAPGWLYHRTRQAALVLVVLGMVAFLVDGANRPANPRLLPPNGVVTDAGFAGLGATLLSIRPGPGLAAPTRPACALLARTPAQLTAGLAGQRSFHHFAGIVLALAHPADATLTLKGTVIPLSVAWFGAGGSYLGALDGAPCPAAEVICPTYQAGRPFSLVLEVPRGTLGSLGIGAGSTLQLAGPCSG